MSKPPFDIMSSNSVFQLKDLLPTSSSSDIRLFPHLIFLSRLGNFNPGLETFKNNASLLISTDSSFISTPNILSNNISFLISIVSKNGSNELSFSYFASCIA